MRLSLCSGLTFLTSRPKLICGHESFYRLEIVIKPVREQSSCSAMLNIAELGQTGIPESDGIPELLETEISGKFLVIPPDSGIAISNIIL